MNTSTMAAYVCLRSCCKHVCKTVSSSAFRHTTGFHSPVTVPLFSKLQPAVRLYCNITVNCPHRTVTKLTFTAFSPRALFSRIPSVGRWLTRGLRSQRKDDRFEVIQGIPKAREHSLLRPLIFTVITFGTSFVGAMIWQYESLRARAQTVIKGLERQMSQMFEPHYQKEMDFRAHLNAIWNKLSDGQKMVAGIIACNFLVFLAWKSPQIQPFLLRYFVSVPGNPSISMVLSAFSHYNLWHIAANMYVLWSFASVSLSLFGREQWLAVYISSAAISSFASLASKVLRHGSIAPSLGASGAIMCLLGAVCITHPEARLSIAFIGEIFPHSFSASTALKAIILLDTAGLVLGWRVFDHAAHLGGVLFGIWYATYGHKMVWGQRENILRWWHDLRGKP